MMLAWMPGPLEMAILAGIALLFFGNRLPEVARNFGKTFSAFKRGLDQAQGELRQEIFKVTDEVTKTGEEVKKD
jgi:sec-independent protein translocase protein TatA